MTPDVSKLSPFPFYFPRNISEKKIQFFFFFLFCLCLILGEGGVLCFTGCF